MIITPVKTRVLVPPQDMPQDDLFSAVQEALPRIRLDAFQVSRYHAIIQQVLKWYEPIRIPQYHLYRAGLS